MRSCASSAGGTSTPRSSSRGRERRSRTCGRAATAGSTTPTALAAWKEGMTGYPLVDAGMRQLRREGWMHNRARMVAASFLVKDLGIDWREGARHFFDLLLDGDVAQNIGNWQWVAGTGVDTRPNRIYNPTAQLKKLDPEGDYVRRYVPELADVPARAHRRAGVAGAVVSGADRRPCGGGRGVSARGVGWASLQG